jgi:hypothetical protein
VERKSQVVLSGVSESLDQVGHTSACEIVGLQIESGHRKPVLLRSAKAASQRADGNPAKVTSELLGKRITIVVHLETRSMAERWNSATPGSGLKPTRDFPANPNRFPALAAVILLARLDIL